MSLMSCEKHGLLFDSDWRTECPCCERDAEIHAEGIPGPDAEGRDAETVPGPVGASSDICGVRPGV